MLVTRVRIYYWKKSGLKRAKLKKLTSVWKQEKRLTRKGWRVELATSKMRFSASSDSTSSRAMMSPFFSALMAKYSHVLRYCARMTCAAQSSTNVD